MAHLKFPDQVESEIHQTLGAEKIEEICTRYFLGDIGKKILNNILSRLTLEDLLRNKVRTSEVITEESIVSFFGRLGEYRHKKTIGKIVGVIAELFSLKVLATSKRF